MKYWDAFIIVKQYMDLKNYCCNVSDRRKYKTTTHFPHCIVS